MPISAPSIGREKTHPRRDVRRLNELARAALLERGLIEERRRFRTEDAGDQIVFLRNEASLGVKNGMIGRVVEAGKGSIVAELGGGNGPDEKRRVEIDQRVYRNIDHGYATTVQLSSESNQATIDARRSPTRTDQPPSLTSCHQQEDLTMQATYDHIQELRAELAMAVGDERTEIEAELRLAIDAHAAAAAEFEAALAVPD